MLQSQNVHNMDRFLTNWVVGTICEAATNLKQNYPVRPAE